PRAEPGDVAQVENALKGRRAFGNNPIVAGLEIALSLHASSVAHLQGEGIEYEPFSNLDLLCATPLSGRRRGFFHFFRNAHVKVDSAYLDGTGNQRRVHKKRRS